MSKIIGIDLGTTNSCFALMEGGEPKVISNREGNRTTPSVVAFTKSGDRLVGQTAKRQAITNPENTIFSAKRFIGRRLEEVENERKNMPFEIRTGQHGEAVIHAKFQDRNYTPPEISAMVLQKIKADAEHYLGEPVTQAVITVPAYFNDSQHEGRF